MKVRFSLLTMLGCLLILGIAACSDDDEVASVPVIETSEYSYIGGNGEACTHCHSDDVSDVLLTKHTQAFDDLADKSQTNLYCVQCHTVGFDSEVAYGDTVIAPENYGPNEDGYDDYVGVAGEEADTRRAALEGVQCENCHGPMGEDFPSHAPDISYSTHEEDGESTSLCYPCHPQIDEWVESGHGTVQQGSIDDFNDEYYANSSSCQPCHTSEGYIWANDAAYATRTFPDRVSFIGCPTCHDPHKGEAGSGNFAQLRNLEPVEVGYHPGLVSGDPGVPAMEDYGPAQTCAQCHHARRDTDEVEDQIAVGSSHFGPHYNPQMDMFIGDGSYEIADATYEREHSHQGIEIACVECHMVREALVHGELQDHSFHTFEPTVGNCEPCHTLPDFNYHNRQTITQEKMDELAVALGYTDAADLLATFDDDNTDENFAVWKREAAYALYFVAHDGSLGVHNPNYSEDLLQNAIDYVNSQGGKMAMR